VVPARPTWGGPRPTGDDHATVGPYHRRVVSPFLLVAVLVVGLLALAPTRRLYVAGRSPGIVASYFVCLWLLGVLVALAPRLARLVVPVLLVLYIVPFLNWRAGLDRLLGRRGEVRPPMKNVTPPRDEAGETR
jgi:hypothetical protein